MPGGLMIPIEAFRTFFPKKTGSFNRKNVPSKLTLAWQQPPEFCCVKKSPLDDWMICFSKLSWSVDFQLLLDQWENDTVTFEDF